MTILCARCGPQERERWVRVFDCVPVVWRDKTVGTVAVLRCRECRGVAAVPVRA